MNTVSKQINKQTNENEQLLNKIEQMKHKKKHTIKFVLIETDWTKMSFSLCLSLFSPSPFSFLEKHLGKGQTTKWIIANTTTLTLHLDHLEEPLPELGAVLNKPYKKANFQSKRDRIVLIWPNNSISGDFDCIFQIRTNAANTNSVVSPLHLRHVLSLHCSYERLNGNGCRCSLHWKHSISDCKRR